MAAQWTCIWSPTTSTEEETTSQCFPTVEAKFAARDTSTWEKSLQLQKTASRCSSLVISADPVASQHLHLQSTPELPWLCSTGSEWVRGCPTAWRFYSPCSRRQQDAEDPYQHRRCLRALEPRHRSWQRPTVSSADPAVRAAPSALLLFTPTSLITNLPSVLNSSLWRDRGITPDFYQVM